MSSLRLRELIRNVRSCKTAEEERKVIAKECADIRTQLKDEDCAFRARNVAKLMYIHMLGYSTHFGQMECIRLITSQKYPEKRVGYLGLMILLDENQEVLTLVENSLAKDLRDKNQFVQALALNAIANIASADIARDLSGEVEKLLFNSNPYIRKKAALCAVRIFRKVPELIENYVEKLNQLINERNHGCLITVVTLITEAITNAPEHTETFVQLVPKLVRILKNLLMSSFALEHDVSGVADPFLQVKVLRLLRILGKGNQAASEQMNDILAQVATNTEGNKNAGNAILYECVLTIMDTESESGLRVLAINILGRFLMNRDNNIRYVALNTLAKVVNKDLQAVQRHRNTIIDCLKDHDVSIRKRALELVYTLVTESNIRLLVPELLNYLQMTDPEFKEDLVAKICTVVDKFAPNKEWHIDTFIRVFEMGGKYVREELGASFIALVTQSPEHQAYATKKLYTSALESTQLDMLTQVAVWCVGEYGDLLIQDRVSEADVVGFVVKTLENPHATLVMKEYCLTALAKLATRGFDSQIPTIQAHINKHKTNIAVELQQRSCEYANLLNWTNIRKDILDHMPAIEREAPTPTTPSTTNEQVDRAAPVAAQETVVEQPKQESASLFDIDSLLGPMPTTTTTAPVTTATTTTAPVAAAAPADDLLGLLGAPIAKPQNTSNSLFDLITPTQPPARAQPADNAPNKMLVYDENGLQLHFNFQKDPNQPDTANIMASFVNVSSVPISELVLQVAVPKYVKLVLGAPSSSNLAPNRQDTIFQKITVSNSLQGQKPLLMKLKIDFKLGGTPVSTQLNLSQFPPGFQ
eukprot:GEZU01023001.1.p1 GENE.GEZU01023001.1~~GEZU01023001.1.p1  ORF type:complete len:814 (-),score=236.92 GEZU01023001.1:145-2586(-)